MATSTTPKHYLVDKAGNLTIKNQNQTSQSKPKVIDYTHAVRILKGVCQHENIDQLKATFKVETLEKDGLIGELKKLLQLKDLEIASKNQQISLKDREIEKLNEQLQQKNQDLTLSLGDSDFEKFDRSFTKEEEDKKQVINMMTNESSSFLPLTFEKIKQSKIQLINPVSMDTVNEIVDSLKSAQNNLKNMSKTLNKPKRKYNFFNKELQSQKINEIKEANETNTELEISSFSSSSSSNTLDFIQTKLQDAQLLKQSLIFLENKAKQQQQKMRQYYQNQIQHYIDLLNQKSSDKFVLNSTRVNLLLEQQSEEIEKIEDEDSIDCSFLFEQNCMDL